MLEVYLRFLKWAEEGRLDRELLVAADSPYPNELDNHIATVFGFPDAASIEHDDEVYHLVRLLMSEHGWSVYKMLLARKS